MADKTASWLFAENVVNTKFENLPESYVSRAEMRMVDAVGVLSAGCKGAGIPGALELVKSWGGPEEATVINEGFKLPVANAAWINSLQIRSFDSEAIDAEGRLASWPAHVSSSTIPAGLALAEKYDMSGKEFLAAMAVGEDLACRITEASRFSPLGCFDGNGTANCMGVAAIAAKAMGLDEVQTQAAFGIALHSCGGTMKSTNGSWCFKLGNSNAAKYGIISAQLAATGYQGLPEPFTDGKCYFDMFAPAAEVEDFTLGLGKDYFSDAVIKPWACCRGNHCALDAATQILDQHGIFKPEEIAHITIGGSNSITNGEYNWGSTCEADGLFNKRFTLSTFLLTGGVTAASYDPAWMTSDALKQTIEKVEFVTWNPLAGKAKGSDAFAAYVDVELVNGEKLHGEVQGIVLGDVNRKPMSREMFDAKWNSNAAFGGKVDIAKLREAYDMAWNLRDVAKMSDFIKLLVP